jgi:hypothetical protein
VGIWGSFSQGMKRLGFEAGLSGADEMNTVMLSAVRTLVFVFPV